MLDFSEGPGIRTLVLELAQPARYPLSHLSSLTCIFFSAPQERPVHSGWQLLGSFMTAFPWKSKAALAPHKF